MFKSLFPLERVFSCSFVCVCVVRLYISFNFTYFLQTFTPPVSPSSRLCRTTSSRTVAVVWPSARGSPSPSPTPLAPRRAPAPPRAPTPRASPTPRSQSPLQKQTRRRYRSSQQGRTPSRRSIQLRKRKRCTTTKGRRVAEEVGPPAPASPAMKPRWRRTLSGSAPSPREILAPTVAQPRRPSALTDTCLPWLRRTSSWTTQTNWSLWNWTRRRRAAWPGSSWRGWPLRKWSRRVGAPWREEEAWAGQGRGAGLSWRAAWRRPSTACWWGWSLSLTAAESCRTWNRKRCVWRTCSRCLNAFYSYVYKSWNVESYFQPNGHQSNKDKVWNLVG